MEIFKDKKQTLIAFGILLAVGFLAYSNSFHGEFQFDDESSILKNSAVRMGTFERLWDSSKTRFVPYVTLAFNYRLHGADVFGYHVINFLIHLLSAFAVYFFSQFLLCMPKISDSARKIPKDFIALFAALFFLSHPLQTQAVSYIVQRMASLAALFYISTCVFYLHFRLSGNKIAYLLSLLFAALAFLSKENTFTLPFAILLLEWIGWGFSKKDCLSKTVKIAPFFLITSIFFSFYFFWRSGPAESSVASGILQAVEREKLISSKEYLFTQFRVICTYIRLLVFPVHQVMDYDYPIYRSFFAPPVLAGFTFLSALFASGFFLLKKERLLAFGIFWFFLTLSIESSIVPIQDVIFEHRMYLPMAGAAVLLSYGIYKICRNSKIFLISASILVAILSVMTFSRNSVWQTKISLGKDNLKKSPNKSRVFYVLARAYGEPCPEEAFYYYQKSIVLDPKFELAYVNLSVCYIKAGDLIKAEKYLKKAIKDNPTFYLSYYNLAGIYWRRGEKNKAIEMYEQTLKLQPDFVEAWNKLGVLSIEDGNYEKASAYWQQAIRRDPSDVDSQLNLGLFYSERRKWDLAAKQLEETLKYAPRLGEAVFRLGVAYFNLDRRAEAERQLAVLKELQERELVAQLEEILHKKSSG